MHQTVRRKSGSPDISLPILLKDIATIISLQTYKDIYLGNIEVIMS